MSAARDLGRVSTPWQFTMEFQKETTVMPELSPATMQHLAAVICLQGRPADQAPIKLWTCYLRQLMAMRCIKVIGLSPARYRVTKLGYLVWTLRRGKL